MPRNFSVVEPHPSVVNHGGYIGSGIGGAGNYKHYNRDDNDNYNYNSLNRQIYGKPWETIALEKRH